MELDFEKMNGLIPAIIQDNSTQKVLMLGFMNKEAYQKTVETGKVTFFSRTKNRLWTKGEESGNFLHVVSIKADCDNDTLLIMVNPAGPVCHTGTDTCWGEKNEQDIMFLKELQDFIDKRYEEMPEGSYTTSLFKSGVNKMAQKVGEEAVETIIEACNGTDERLIYEGSDLLCIKFRIIRKECEIKKTDMMNRKGFFVILTSIEVIKGAAQIREGTLCPVMFIIYLHF